MRFCKLDDIYSTVQTKILALSNQKLWKARSENNFFLFFEINFIAILFIDFNDIANVKVDIITLHSENPLVLPEFNIICVF